MDHGEGVGSGDTEVGTLVATGDGVVTGDTKAPVFGSSLLSPSGWQPTKMNSATPANNHSVALKCFEGIAISTSCHGKS